MILNFFIAPCHKLIFNMPAGLTGGLSRGSRRERLLSKFTENEFEKIDRLMELFLRWVDLSPFSRSHKSI